MRRLAVLPLVLAGCLPQNETPRPAAPQSGPPQSGALLSGPPMTLPLADGRPMTVTFDFRDYSVSRQQTSHGFAFRVTRQGRDFDYAEGALAKNVAVTYCKGFNRGFSARAMGRFSVPNSWVFDGDCA